MPEGRLSSEGPRPPYVPVPYYADVHMWIGQAGQDIQTIPPEVIQEFSYTNTILSAGNQFAVTLIDQDWDVLEKQIVESQELCFFQFGYTNNPALRSPIYCLKIQAVQPSFGIDHATLKIEGVSAGMIYQEREAGAYECTFTWGEGTECVWPQGEPNQRSLIPDRFVDLGGSRAYPDGMTIAEICQEIAWKNGLVPHIDETFNLWHTDQLEGTKSIDRAWIQPRTSDFAFLKHYLLPNCLRKSDKKSGYTIYFKDAMSEAVSMSDVLTQSSNAGWELHLHVKDYDKDPEFEYIYMRDQLSSVIEFTPNVAPAVMFTLGGAETGAPQINHNTGRRDLPTASLTSDQEKTIMEQYASLFGSGGWIRVGDTDKWKPVSSRFGKTTFASPKNWTQGRAIAKQRFIEMFDMSITAEMTVQGDPRLEPNKVARVIVMTPPRSIDGISNPYDQLHYTSGIYLIAEVTHTISGGNYHSSMKLQKNAIISAIGGQQVDASNMGTLSPGSSATAHAVEG